MKCTVAHLYNSSSFKSGVSGCLSRFWIQTRDNYWRGNCLATFKNGLHRLLLQLLNGSIFYNTWYVSRRLHIQCNLFRSCCCCCLLSILSSFSDSVVVWGDLNFDITYKLTTLTSSTASGISLMWGPASMSTGQFGCCASNTVLLKLSSIWGPG